MTKILLLTQLMLLKTLIEMRLANLRSDNNDTAPGLTATAVPLLSDHTLKLDKNQFFKKGGLHRSKCMQ